MKKENALYKDILNTILEQNKCAVWKYDVSKGRMMLEGGSHVFFLPEDTLNNVPECLLKDDLIHADSKEDFSKMYEDMSQGKETAECVIKIKEQGGQYRWQKISNTICSSEEDPSNIYIAYAENLTSAKEAEKHQLLEEQLRKMISEDVIAVSQVNLTKNAIKYLWAQGIPEEEAKKIKSYTQMCAFGRKKICNKDDRKKYDEIFDINNLLDEFKNGNYNFSMECRYKGDDERIIWVDMSANIMQEENSGDILYYSFIRNIDGKKKMELMLRERAERDALTGLYNKITAQSMIQEVLNRNKESKKKCALLVMDVDSFKQVNDNYGHPFGDYILTEIAKILERVFGAHAIVGRLGGDEFLAFLNENITEKEVLEKTEQVFAAIHEIYLNSTQLKALSASAGISFLEMKEASFERLYEEADIALYDAKMAGKNRLEVYNNQSRTPIAPYEDDGCLAKDYLHKSCMMEEIEEMTFIIDADTYDLLYMNQAARKTFSEVDLLKSIPKCYKVLHDSDEPCSYCNKHKPNYESFNVWHSTNYKLNRQFIVKDKMMQQNGKNYRFEIFFDSAQLEKAQNSLLSDVLMNCLETLASKENIESSINKVLEYIADFYGAERTYVLERVEEEPAQMLYEWYRDGTASARDAHLKQDVDALSRWVRGISEDMSVIVTDLKEIKTKYPAQYEVLKKRGIKSLCIEPFEVPGVMKGYIGIDNITKHKGSFTYVGLLAFLIGTEIARRRMKEKETYIRYHDPLTNLLNRNSYLQYTEEAEVDAFSSLGVMAVDINGLRKVNDKYGHSYGDSMIKNIGQALNDSFINSKIFRFSGGEYLILCEDMTKEAFERMAESAAEEIGKQYPSSIAYGYTWEDTNIRIERMARNAKELLLVSKRKYYEEVEKNDYVHPYVLEELLKALEDREFAMYLQPKVDLATEKIEGAEALVRHIPAEGKVISPGEFIPILERQNYIRHIDLFIFEEACKALQKWKEGGVKLFPISVNFSRVTLMETDIIEEMNRITDKYQVPKEYLEIELTESFADMGTETLKRIGERIIENGYRISLDDFGVEYSGVYILSILDLDTLKMDKTLVDALYNNKRLETIAEHVIELCHKLGVKCVAEGTETKEQIDVLKRLGCDCAQGYYYNKPIPLENFEERYIHGEK